MRRAWLLVLCLGVAAEAGAQRVIYDGKRDTTAQQAAAVAKDVTSGSLFDTMLRNMDTQARLEVEIVTASTKEQMRSKLNAFRVWFDPRARPQAPGSAFSLENARMCPSSIDCVLRTLLQQHQASLSAPAMTPGDLEMRLARIAARRTELQAALDALKKESASRDPGLVRAFGLLEDPGGDVLAYAQRIAALASANVEGARGIGSALDAVESGMDQVLAIYHAVESIWKGQRAVAVDPASLRPSSQQIDLQRLAVEQAHLQDLARIDARMRIEVGDALGRVEGALNSLTAAGVAQSAEPIETTLRRAAAAHDRERLFALTLALHDAAAAVAQVDAASGLAQLRIRDEARRYSIRLSAVNARTYDTTIQAAVQRLALYWKSGLKPAELAQFVFYITSTFALPAIAIGQE